MTTDLRGAISLRWLSHCWEPPASDHGPSLAPFFAIQAAYGERRRLGPLRWAWSDPRAVEEATASAWHLTGRWLARRGVSVRRSEFEARVAVVVPKLARALNAQRVGSLRDLRGRAEYRRVALCVNEAIHALSTLRATAQVQPVFGSKVLHHFFPSIVPAFDDRYVRNGVLRLEEARALERDDDGAWLSARDRPGTRGSAMRQFDLYLAACTIAVARAPTATLLEVRRRFGHAFAPYAPGAFASDPSSLLWRLDAKIAEYCLLGVAVQRGCLER